MGNEKRCELCTDKCPKAETLHETSKGRMYATKAFIDLQKKVEIGQLVEVVRCKDCIRYRNNGYSSKDGICLDRCDIGAHEADVYEDDFCSYGERRDETDENERNAL